MLKAGLVSLVILGSIITNPVSVLSAETGASVQQDMSNVAVLAASYKIADYDSVDYISRYGRRSTLSVSGGKLMLKSSCASDVRIEVRDNSTYKRLASDSSADGNVTVNAASKMKRNRLCYVNLSLSADGVDYLYGDNFIIKDDNGDLHFVVSPVYEYNREKCSEMWTDANSLKECLQPQNDVDCDDPMVIAKSNEICRGLTNDWEKAFAIYTFVTNELIYDDIQVEDQKYVYQDDVPTLLRRKMGICEGFANVFVALCRVQKIPAVVQFGVTQSFDVFLNDKTKRDSEWPNHAWAAVYLGNEWFFVDPTFDNQNHFTGKSRDTGKVTRDTGRYDYYLQTLETFSMLHKVCDADTIHGIESSGSCGTDATYKITRDGTLTIYGKGEIKLPEGINGFSKVVFAPDSNITSIGEDCFVDCDLITEVILPETVTEIKNKAFNTCEDLQYIYLPLGLKSIGQEAFDFCDELAYVYVPDSVTRIDKYAFDDCPRLMISIPKSLKGFDGENYVNPYRIIVRN